MAGIDPASAAISLIGGFLQGASSPEQFQPKLPFTGSADPNQWMGQLHDALASLMNSEGEDVANNPHVSAPGMPLYQPHGTMQQAVQAPHMGAAPAAPAASGPQRRPAAFTFPTTATGASHRSPDSSTVVGHTNFGSNPDGSPLVPGLRSGTGLAVRSAPSGDAGSLTPDMHAANLALLALQSGKPQAA